MKKKLKLHYWRSKNFGDHLNEYIVENYKVKKEKVLEVQENLINAIGEALKNI